MNFLILTHHIKNFAGSEINTFQIANALKVDGNHVDIGTFIYDEPMKTKYDNQRLNVINLLSDTTVENCYDVVWAHHFPVLSYVLFQSKLKSAKIIFCSLGPHEPLENPPIYHGEIPLILAISEETKKHLINLGVKDSSIQVFPNFAEKKYFSICKTVQKDYPKRIAVISNHPPIELREVKESLKEARVDLEFFGAEDNSTYIDETKLLEYDLVITIGKTIQYCFALKIPVYCYDYFGGPGFLNSDNFHKARWHNFSGRGFSGRLTGEELSHDILRNYDKNVDFIDSLHEIAKDDFCLENNIKNVIDNLSYVEVSEFHEITTSYPIERRMNEAYTRELKNRIYFENKYFQYKWIENEHLPILIKFRHFLNEDYGWILMAIVNVINFVFSIPKSIRKYLYKI